MFGVFCERLLCYVCMCVFQARSGCYSQHWANPQYAKPGKPFGLLDCCTFFCVAKWRLYAANWNNLSHELCMFLCANQYTDGISKYSSISMKFVDFCSLATLTRCVRSTFRKRHIKSFTLSILRTKGSLDLFFAGFLVGRSFDFCCCLVSIRLLYRNIEFGSVNSRFCGPKSTHQFLTIRYRTYAIHYYLNRINSDIYIYDAQWMTCRNANVKSKSSSAKFWHCAK